MGILGVASEDRDSSRETLRSSPSGSLPNVGDLVAGKYRIESLLGSGAMGAVFVARHELLDKRVALKLICEDQAQAPHAVTRFYNEARAAAKIEGEHVARVLDVGQHENGTPFIALELLEGANLAEVLETRAPLPVHEVVGWILQVCEALAEAHSFGIVHRDLKPANLFLARRRDGRSIVKVLDFGVAKTHAPLQPAMTVTSSILGSPVYMAPEQLRSAKSVDARADIWALGVVLYELLTGRLPFRGDYVAVVFVAGLEHTPPAPRTLRADVPEALERVVLRCLAREVDHRFQSVAELAEALAPFAGSDACFSVQRIRTIMESAPEWAQPKRRRRGSSKRSARFVTVAVTAVGIGALAAMGLMAARGATTSQHPSSRLLPHAPTTATTAPP